MHSRFDHLVTLASMLALLASPLVGCDSAEGTACGTDAECPTGQTCATGTCLASAGQAAVAGNAATGGNASAGSAGFAGSAAASGSSGAPAAGASTGGVSSAGSGAGGVPAGGMTSVGGAAVGGSTSGGQSQGGSGNPGGAGGSAGTGGSAGAGVVVDPGPTIGKCDNDFWPAANNGSVTRYDFRQGTQLPACSYVITHSGKGNDGDWDTVEGISTGDGGYFGAMNTADYNKGAACGACVEASYNGRKVVLTIVDECPIGSNKLCVKGHIDLSRKAIRQLEPNGRLEHLKGVSWKYVKCPATGNVKVRLHPNQNANWQPVVIENGLFPIKSVTLNGMSAKRVGNEVDGNAWEVGALKAPYTARVTDVNGNAITVDVPGGRDLKDTGKQFMCQ